MAFDMPAPLNYMLNVPDPTEDIRKSLELGIQLRQSQQNRELHAAQIRHLNTEDQEAQQKMAGAAIVRQQDADFQSRLQEAASKKGGPTSDDIMGLASTPTGLRHAKPIQDNYKNLVEREQKTVMSTLIPGFAALSRGEYGTAEDTFRTAAAASENDGNAKLAKTFGDHADMIAKNPGLATSVVGMAGNAIDPKFIESYGTQATQASAIKKAGAEAKKLSQDAEDERALNAAEVYQRTKAGDSSGAAAEATKALSGPNVAAKIADAAKTTGETRDQAAVEDLVRPTALAKLQGDQIGNIGKTADAAKAIVDAIAQPGANKVKMLVQVSEALKNFASANETNALAVPKKDKLIAEVAKDVAENEQAKKMNPLLVQQMQENVKAGTEANAQAKLVNPLILSSMRAEIGSKVVGLLQSVNKMPDALVQPLIESRDKANVHLTAAKASLDLATGFKKVPGGLTTGGIPGGLRDSAVRAMGSDDWLSALRTKFEGYKNKQVMDVLRGSGKITNMEVDLAQKGFPEGTADAKTIVTYLEHAANIEAALAEYELDKVAWYEQQKDVGLANKPGILNGRPYHVRQSFEEVRRLTPAEAVKLEAHRQRRAAK